MSKHTPGPWFPVLNTAKSWDVNVEPDLYGQSIASCMSNAHIEGDPEANALLIAAAPELLKELMWYAEQYKILTSDAAEYRRPETAALIAKAKGES